MNIKSVSDIGHILRERRRHLGWDQQRLADEIGVSRQWVIQLEKGKARAAVALVLRAFQALSLAIAVTPQNQRTAGQSGSAARKSSEAAASIPEVDLDQIIEKARGRKQ